MQEVTVRVHGDPVKVAEQLAELAGSITATHVRRDQATSPVAHQLGNILKIDVHRLSDDI